MYMLKPIEVNDEINFNFAIQTSFHFTLTAQINKNASD